MRWQIEVFFKTLKQNLKVKTFIGVSENALRIQIWTALIALLVIKWLHYLSKAGWSFSNILNSCDWSCGNLDSLFHFKVQKKRETRFRTCPIWPPGPLQLLGHVFNLQIFWTSALFCSFFLKDGVL